MIRYLLLIFAVLTLPLVSQENLILLSPKPTHPEDKSRVQVDALFSMAAPTGYLPVRVTIINQRKADVDLRLDTISSSGSGSRDSEVKSEFSISSAAGKSSKHDILVPLTTVLDYSRYGSGSANTVILDGQFGQNRGRIESNYAEHFSAVMMSEKLYTPNASTLDAAINKLSGRSSSASFAGKFDPLQMPEDWRAYSGYDAFLMTDDDWRQISPGGRNAILQWCRLGGELVIHRLSHSTTFESLGVDSDDGNYGYGSITLDSIPSTLALDATALIEKFQHKKLVSPSLNKSILEDYSSTWPLHAEFGHQKFSYGIFVVILIGFGILVGPVNLFVFAKSGERHKLFITTPIISLATSFLLILIILIKDGTGGKGGRIALIEVRPDSGENNAYVLQEQISRTGVLLGGSFVLSESAAITPLPISASEWARLTPGDGGGGMRYTSNLKNGQLAATGDWFQSRSEQGQLIRAVVPTRGRIEFKESAGGPKLLSTFEFTIDHLYYKDRKNSHWVIKSLEPGETTKGNPISQSDYETGVNLQMAKLGRRHRMILKTAMQRPDHYVAITNDAPAIDSFDPIDWTSTHTILTGPTLR